jgi:hypothetical protein
MTEKAEKYWKKMRGFNYDSTSDAIEVSALLRTRTKFE